MLYTYPDYYKEFQCIADKCEDTCCAGWQIVVDEESLQRYKQETSDYKETLHASIDWKEQVFRQDKEKRCAFLREDNLCEMYINLGEESLCKTCTNYPRHIEEFEDEREISLSISCPEVARMLIAKKEPVKFWTVEKDGTDEFEDFDPFLYSMLQDARTCLFEIIQNRKLPMENRMVLSLGLTWDLENRVQAGQLFECENVIETYRKQTYFAAAGKKADNLRRSVRGRYTFSRKMFENLRQFELLKKDWEYVLNETEILLFSYGTDSYRKIHSEFYQWIREHEDAYEKAMAAGLHLEKLDDWSWDIFSEQLMVYFVFTYFCGAVYDGKVLENVQMAVACISLIWDLLAVRWVKNEKHLDAEDIREIVYRFSRELEHSDENKNIFWKCLEAQKELFR